MNTTSTRDVVLRRSWNIWVLLVALLVIGGFYWAAKLNGHGSDVPQNWYGRKARSMGLAAPFVAVFGMAYDIYQRLVRDCRLEFSDHGIGEYASPDQLGEIAWDVVDGVAFKRQWLGTTFIINFKSGVPINDHVESWDKLVIESLQVTDEDAARISALLQGRKIPGGLDQS